MRPEVWNGWEPATYVVQCYTVADIQGFRGNQSGAELLQKETAAAERRLGPNDERKGGEERFLQRGIQRNWLSLGILYTFVRSYRRTAITWEMFCGYWRWGFVFTRPSGATVSEWKLDGKPHDKNLYHYFKYHFVELPYFNTHTKIPKMTLLIWFF